MQKKIVVGIDGSEPSFHAVQMAAELATRNEARLVLVHALWPNLLSPAIYPELLEQLDRQERNRAGQMMADLMTRASLGGLDPAQVITPGAPAETLADVAAAEDAWMVVVGSHGRNAAGRVLLGSVADRLIHICRKPVLVVR